MNGEKENIFVHFVEWKSLKVYSIYHPIIGPDNILLIEIRLGRLKIPSSITETFSQFLAIHNPLLATFSLLTVSVNPTDDLTSVPSKYIGVADCMSIHGAEERNKGPNDDCCEISPHDVNRITAGSDGGRRNGANG